MTMRATLKVVVKNYRASDFLGIKVLSMCFFFVYFKCPNKLKRLPLGIYRDSKRLFRLFAHS